MIDIPIDHVMTRSARAVRPETPVTRAAQHLRDPEVPAVVVLEDESVVGIVTESDVVAFVAETLEPHPVAAIMTEPVSTISPSESIRAAAQTMRTNGVRHLPVVRGDTYYGLVSASMLAPYLSRRQLEIDRDGDPMRIDDDPLSIPVSE